MLLARALLAGLVCALVGCRDDGGVAIGEASSGAGTTAAATTSGTTSGSGSSSSGSADTTDGGSSTGEPGDPPELAPLCPDGLPFAYDRPDEGDPLDAAELADATSRYLEL